MAAKLFKLLVVVFILGISFNNYSQSRKFEHSIKSEIILKNKSFFNDENDELSYALGASLGNYMKNSFKEQEHLGIFLDNSKFILGIQDAIGGIAKLSSEKVSNLLQILENRLKIASNMEFKKQSKKNIIEGKTYSQIFLKNPGAKKTKSGLLYLIEKKGNTNDLKKSENNIFTVHYKGMLINGTEFDSSYSRGKPFTFTLDSVIPGWQEGLKLINKKGKIRLVVPPELAYKDTILPGIPVNSTLIFDIEVLDIKNFNSK